MESKMNWKGFLPSKNWPSNHGDGTAGPDKLLLTVKRSKWIAPTETKRREHGGEGRQAGLSPCQVTGGKTASLWLITSIIGWYVGTLQILPYLAADKQASFSQTGVKRRRRPILWNLQVHPVIVAQGWISQLVISTRVYQTGSCGKPESTMHQGTILCTDAELPRSTLTCELFL